MDQNETTFYNQAITLAKMGHREQAYSFFKRIAYGNQQDQNVLFWMAYTAPSLEIAQELLDRAHFINPENPALIQANQWLTNEKLNLPQPSQGFSLFPPANHQTQVMPYYQPQQTTSYYQPQQTAPYNYPSQDPYSTQQVVPYQPVPNYQPYQTQAYGQSYYPFPTMPGCPPIPSPTLAQITRRWCHLTRGIPIIRRSGGATHPPTLTTVTWRWGGIIAALTATLLTRQPATAGFRPAAGLLSRCC